MMAESRIRLIAEDDIAEGLSELLQDGARREGISRRNMIITHRPGVSDAILYPLLLEPMMKDGKVALVFPLNQPVEFPLPQSVIIDVASITDFFKTITVGKIYRLAGAKQVTVLEQTENALRKFLPRQDKKFPIIFVFDTLQKWDDKLDTLVRFLVREAPLANFGVWIHSPIAQVPQDLFPSIGNVVAVWPSQQEIEFLKQHLPADVIGMENQKYTRGALIFSNKLVEGKGWEWTEFEPD